MTAARAKLTPEVGEEIEFMFNPAEFTVSKRMQWGGGEAKGRNAPQIRFQSGQSGTMALSITLDSTLSSVPILHRVQQLMALVTVHANLEASDGQRNSARPPWVDFHWGPFHSFRAVVESLQVKFTFFSSDGTPLRARCDLQLKQYADAAVLNPQNPTSGTPHPHTVHRLAPGETLSHVATRHLGDATKWRVIADANGITDPLRPEAGAVLVVPELEAVRIRD